MAKCKDEDLQKGLTQARKSARFFALIARGSVAVKLIVQKKAPKSGDILNAKSEFKGNAVVEGVCLGDGAEMVFQVLGEDPGIKVISIKDLIDEEASLTMKARFEVVKELANVDQGEDVVTAPVAPSPAEATPTAETPPDAPPPAPPLPTANPEITTLVAAMSKLAPRIQEAIKKAPDRRESLAQGVAGFQKQVKAQDAVEAKAALVALNQMVKEILAEATTPSPTTSTSTAEPEPTTTPQPAGDPKAAKWDKDWGELKSDYEAALKTASSDLASKLRVIQAYAGEQAEATQYDKAQAALARLRPLIEEAKKGSGASSEVVAGTVEKRKYMLERIKQLPVVIRPEIDELKKAIVRDVPDEDAEDLCGQIEVALQMLYDELQDEIDAAINKGDMSLLVGLKGRVLSNELVSHLVTNPMTQGKPFEALIVAALDEIEAKLAG